MELHDIISDKQYKFKIGIILHYNKTKGVVDAMEKIVNEYSVKSATKRSSFVLFQNIIDIASLNAFILWLIKYLK